MGKVDLSRKICILCFDVHFKITNPLASIYYILRPPFINLG